MQLCKQASSARPFQLLFIIIVVIIATWNNPDSALQQTTLEGARSLMISDGDDPTLREKTALRSLWRLSSSGQKHRLHSGRLRSTGLIEHWQVQHTSSTLLWGTYSRQQTAYLSLMYSVQPTGLQHTSSPDGVF